MFKFLTNISNKKAFLVIAVFTFIVFGNSIKNDYSLDDHLVIKNHPYTTKGIKGIKDIFTHHSFYEYRNVYSYRPILLTTFAIEHQFFGQNPHVSHFVNILLYAFLCYLIYLFLSQLLPKDDSVLKWMIVALFIAYPLHTEVVDNIKSRDEILVGIFGISSLYFTMRYFATQKIKYWSYITLLLILGALTKPNFIVYLSGIIILLIIYNLKNKKQLLINAGLVAGTFLLAFLLVNYFKHQFVNEEVSYRKVLYFENPLYYTNLQERIPAGIYIMLYYLKLLFYPFELSYYYGYNHVPLYGWNSFWVYLSLIVIGGLFVLGVKFLNSQKHLAFAAFFLLLNLFAASNILKPLPGIVAERFIFAGSLGFIILLVYGLQYLLTEKIKKANYFQPAFVIILIIFSLRTIARNDDWRDDFYIFEHDLEHLQNSAKAHAVIANQLFGEVQQNPNTPDARQKLQRAEQEYIKCLEIYPDYATSINNLGTIYFKFYGNNQKALELYRHSFALDTTNGNVAFNLAVVHKNLNNQDSAWYYYKKAIRLNPGFNILNQAFVNYAVENHKIDQAILILENIGKERPKEYGVFLSLGNLYGYKNDYNNALKYYEYAYSIFPNPQLQQHIQKLKNQLQTTAR